MEFREYQAKARSTAIFDPKYKYMNPALGLAGEAGETCEKVKKMFRDNDGIVTPESALKLGIDLISSRSVPPK